MIFGWLDEMENIGVVFEYVFVCANCKSDMPYGACIKCGKCGRQFEWQTVEWNEPLSDGVIRKALRCTNLDEYPPKEDEG